MNNKHLTQEEKQKLIDAEEKGYGVEMPGKWASRLIAEIKELEDKLEIANEAMEKINGAEEE